MLIRPSVENVIPSSLLYNSIAALALNAVVQARATAANLNFLGVIVFIGFVVMTLMIKNLLAKQYW